MVNKFPYLANGKNILTLANGNFLPDQKNRPRTTNGCLTRNSLGLCNMTAGEWWKKPQRKCVDQPINWCKGNSALSWKRKETFFPLISASAMQFRYQSSFFFDSINWFREFYSTWEQSCEIFICYLVGWAKDSTLYFTKNSIIAFQIINLKVILKKIA